MNEAHKQQQQRRQWNKERKQRKKRRRRSRWQRQRVLTIIMIKTKMEKLPKKHHSNEYWMKRWRKRTAKIYPSSVYYITSRKMKTKRKSKRKTRTHKWWWDERWKMRTNQNNESETDETKIEIIIRAPSNLHSTQHNWISNAHSKKGAKLMIFKWILTIPYPSRKYKTPYF